MTTSTNDGPVARRNRTKLRAVVTMLTAVLVSSLVIGLAPSLAYAHSGVQSYLYIDVSDEGLGGRVEMPFDDIREVLGLELEGDDDAVLAELVDNTDLLFEYVDDHLDIGDAAGTWELSVTIVTLLEGEGGYAQVHFLADVPYPEVPRELQVTFDPFFDEIEDRDALLLIGNDWKAGVIENGEDVLLDFRPDQRTRTVDLGDASQWKNFSSSIGQGVDHIRSGPDHILFIAVLLLPSVLVFSAGWRPAATFGSALWRILKIVSMFTLAHSITFVLAGIDVLPLPPSRLIESMIALSIAATAVHNLRPVFANREWLIAFVFGLFHGMGFAGFVLGLDLNRETKLVSLLGRNVGIEIGQAVVVLLLFPALFLLRRTRWYRPTFVVGSVGLAVVATAWMIERLFVVDLRVSRGVDPIIQLPRAFVLVVIVTAVAGALYEFERRAGRLRPTVDEHPAEPDPERSLVSSSSR